MYLIQRRNNHVGEKIMDSINISEFDEVEHESLEEEDGIKGESCLFSLSKWKQSVILRCNK